MGYALRTDRHRYVEWREWKTGKVVARELYDSAGDPGETKNLAASPECQGVMRELGDMLQAGWRAAQPPNYSI